ADSVVKFGDYVPGERISITLEYSATCNIVFSGLALWRAAPFSPPRLVSGTVSNASGTPRPGSAGTTGSATFDIVFSTLNKTATGAQSGVARLDLTLGVDKDCDLGTGDFDGIDRTIPIRVIISVSSDPANAD
ncbi:MAG TPA: hypothetical protein VEL75_19285, partial [Candidatus Methylomirabilis sp.]|nr:hypothetical protein [Candidatus Methylomirabilis sp.]